MIEVFNNCPPIVAEAKKAKFKPAYPLQLLIFLGVYIVTTIVQSVPLTIYIIFSSVMAFMRNEIPVSSPAEAMSYMNKELIVPMLFSTCIITVIAILYCRFIEKRSLYSMGFTKDKILPDYGLGLLLGFVMITVSVLISWGFGALEYRGVAPGNGLAMLFVFLLGFIVQGMSEEVLLRGYLMISIASRNSIITAVITNSVLFSLLHIFNGGISVVGIINLTLFGIFASVYVLKTNSIWGACGLHSMWNFTMGNIYGIKVSGIDTTVSLFSFVPSDRGKLLNGGSFGLEGGLAVTVVLCVSIILLLLSEWKTGNPSLKHADT